MRYLQLGQRSVSHRTVPGIDDMIRENAVLLKNPDSTTSRPQASPVHESIRSFDTMPSRARSVEHIPGLLSQNRHRRVRPSNRITLARNGLDQRRFATAVRTENRHVLIGANA